MRLFNYFTGRPQRLATTRLRPLHSYDGFLQAVENIPGIAVRRPLGETHRPSTVTGEVSSFMLESLPGVSFALLHSSASPPASNGDCAYRINNASIVFMMDINGIRVLFTGDANGKERDHRPQGNVGHIESLLLDFEAAHPGTLKAHVLKAPHHGSETASTREFIDAVDPDFVVISASTMRHLPRETVVERYENGQRVILRTDRRIEKHNDHVICAGTTTGEVNCNYKSVLGGIEPPGTSPYSV